MWETPKRGNGKNTNSLTIRDMYSEYRTEKKKSKSTYVKYKEFARIIKTANAKIADAIINDSEMFLMPYRLGALQITKHEKSLSAANNALAIDYKATKENGFVVYHEDRYIYKWSWHKHYSRISGCSYFKFEACRTNKRSVPKALEKKIDYFSR